MNSLRCSLGVVVAVTALVSCAADPTRSASGPQRAQGSAELGGQVVSTVDGYPVTLEDVRELMTLGMTAQQALRTLQDELILIGEAERRGFERDPEVFTVGRKARVQALLHAEASTQQVGEEALREAYQAAGARFRHGERRASVHVLAKLPKAASAEEVAAAESLAREVIGQMQTSPPGALVKRYNGKKLSGLSIVAEQVPPAERGSRFDEAYLDALFSLPGPGVVPNPVRSSFGVHAIRVMRVIPAKNIPFEQARQELERELLVRRQREHIDTWLSELRSDRGVVVTDNVGELLSVVEP